MASLTFVAFVWFSRQDLDGPETIIRFFTLVTCLVWGLLGDTQKVALVLPSVTAASPF